MGSYPAWEASSSVVVGFDCYAKLSASLASGNFNNLQSFRLFERIVASAAEFQHASVGIERSAVASCAQVALTQVGGAEPEHLASAQSGGLREAIGTSSA